MAGDQAPVLWKAFQEISSAYLGCDVWVHSQKSWFNGQGEAWSLGCGHFRRSAIWEPRHSTEGSPSVCASLNLEWPCSRVGWKLTVFQPWTHNGNLNSEVAQGFRCWVRSKGHGRALIQTSICTLSTVLSLHNNIPQERRVLLLSEESC